MGNGAYLVGVAFWVFVGAVSVAGIITDHKKRRLGVDLLRAMIDKGQPLDPALVEKVMSQQAADQRTDPLDLKLGGIIVTAAGIGLLPMAYFIGKLAPIAVYPILGSGVITIFVGAGLLLGAKVIADARERERLNKSPQ
jgi:uncharacterized membrane-anchored protein